MRERFFRRIVGQGEGIPIDNRGLVLDSERLGWKNLSLTTWQGVAPQEAYESALSKHLIVIHATPQPVHVFERTDGYAGEGIAHPGSINLFSAGAMSYCRWDSSLSFYRMDVSPFFLQEVALKSEFRISGDFELAHKLRLQDPKLLQIGQWLGEELQTGGASGQLYFDSLSNLLAVHLLQNYASSGNNPASLPNKLSKQQISRVIEYMHAHLERDISLDELAGVANMSASYLVRLFKQATGLTPHKYFIHLRVEKAKVLIQSHRFSMGEIAALLGFADQSHLNRHFKKIVGATPREFLLNS